MKLILLIATTITLSAAVGACSEGNSTPTEQTTTSPPETTTETTTEATTEAPKEPSAGDAGPRSNLRDDGGQNAPNRSSESKACNLPVPDDQGACHDSYAACAATAKKDVQRYYEGDNPSLDGVAVTYAKATYGSRGLTWQAGYAGCLAALMDEYDRRYR